MVISVQGIVDETPLFLVQAAVAACRKPQQVALFTIDLPDGMDGRACPQERLKVIFSRCQLPLRRRMAA